MCLLILHGSQRLDFTHRQVQRFLSPVLYDYRALGYVKMLSEANFSHNINCIISCLYARTRTHTVFNLFLSNVFHAKFCEMDNPDLVHLQTILHSATICPQRYRIQSCYLNLKWRSALFSNQEELNFRHMSKNHPFA